MAGCVTARTSPASMRIAAGFTVVELLTVLGIIGVLIALLMPAVQSARAAARRTQCLNQLHQFGLALHNYHDVHQTFPPGTIAMGPSFPMQTGWGWQAMLLPYLEQSPLYAGIDFDLGTAVGTNRDLVDQPLPSFVCPSDTAPTTLEILLPGEPTVRIAHGNYCGVEPLLASMSRMRMADVTDGLSQTLLVGERVYQAGQLGSPEYTSAWCGRVASSTQYVFQSIPHLPTTDQYLLNLSLHTPLSFTSRHDGGVQFVLGDGSARLVSQYIDRETYRALGTPSGGESLSF